MQYNTLYQRPISAPLSRLFKGLFIIAVVYIVFMSLRPTGPTSPLSNIDKVVHALAYAVLTGLCALGWPKPPLKLIFLGPALLGASLEIGQALMPFGRTGSWADMAANILGGLVVVMSWIAVVKIYRSFTTEA